MSVEIMQARPPYVQFERRAVEVRAAANDSGGYQSRDVDFALVTPAGSKDVLEREAEAWISGWEEKARRDRSNREALEFSAYFRRIYEHWKLTQEVPTEGTAIRTWPTLSPSEIARVLAANIRTVEDLAMCNEEAMGRIGMGARAMQQKAQTWITSARDHGQVTAQVSALSIENEALKQRLDQLEETNKQLIAELRAQDEDQQKGRKRA